MKLRHKRTLAAAAALALTAPALLALSVESASAGTSTGMITCTNPAGSPPGTPDAPFVLSFTATPPTSIAPSTSAAYSLTGTATVTVPGAVAAGFVDQTGATQVGFNGGKFSLSATHTTGLLTTTLLPSAAPQAITGYTPDPDGAGPGTSNANDITFSFPSITASGATVNATHGQTIVTSLAANQSASGLSLKVLPAGLDLGWGAPGMGGSINSPGAACAGVGAPYGPLGSTSVTDPTPVVTVSGSYGAVAGISNTLSVGVTDAGGSAPIGGSWTISSGPTCTGAGGNGTASISGTASGATVTFDAPDNAATCTIGVTVADGSTTSTVAVLNINVAAGDSLQQDVTQEVAPGVLDLLACGDTNPDPTTCGAEMTAITLNGSDQSTTGDIEQVTVLDARGGPIAWSLSAQLDGDLTNGNGTLTGPNAVIDDALLKITPSCVTATGSSNSPPTAGGAAQALNAPAAICSAVAGQNTGSFLVDGDLDLTVPSTTYAGTYTGTINFIVS